MPTQRSKNAPSTKENVDVYVALITYTFKRIVDNASIFRYLLREHTSQKEMVQSIHDALENLDDPYEFRTS